MADQFGTWVSVDDHYPPVGKIHGYWDSIPVIVALSFSSRRVVGCFFSYRGGDAMDDEGNPQTPVPDFHTDEGLGYPDVICWMPMPKYPVDA
jgi:hypothetical protein